MNDTGTRLTVSSGLSLGVILSMTFLILKLCGVITWSWWIVALPCLIEFTLAVLITLIVIIVVLRKKERLNGKEKRKD